MKKGLLFICFLNCALVAFATHIAGGELYYQRIGPGSTSNSDLYRITMRLFRQCPSTGGTGADLTVEQPRIGIYNTNGLTLVTSVTLTAQFTTVPEIQNNPAANPCLTGTDKLACYQVGTWSGTIELPKNTDGYTLVWTRYTRRDVVNSNVQLNTGGTFVTQIPGTNALPTGFNNSAQFVVRDTSLVCRNTSFSLDFSATDPDTDSLSYRFADPYDGIGGSSTNPDPFNSTGVPATITLVPIPFRASYSTLAPLGAGVTINPKTGIVSGVAPSATGYYVVVVIAEEWRNGVKINEHRKDFTLKVGDCTLAGAQLSPVLICSNFTGTFQNQATSTGITGYAWNFGDPGSGANNTSTLPSPTHTFSDTGRFAVKLTVTNAGGCKDSATAFVSVYPNFHAGFMVTGNCYQSPFSFTDTSRSTYGVVNSWRWDFGEAGVTNDTSNVQNPSYQYPSAGTRTVRLISTCTKGCIDTAEVVVNVRENPLLNLPFKDTLICSIDNIPLQAQGTGNFSWVAVPNDPTLTTPNIPNPVVAPKDTTLYIVTLNDNGCIKKDTITVNVLDFIEVAIGPDTGICRTDTMIMRTVSHALSYQWSPAAGLSSTTVKYPVASPDTTTRYFVTANLGQCQDTASILVRVAPYPVANAPDGGIICYGEKVQLHASYVGTSFSWSPTTSLQNPNTLNPIAGPQHTTGYIFTAYSSGICPKPKSDTAWVIVRPQVVAFAGNDTTITAQQPLQLNAEGGFNYSWTPSFGLSASNIANPIAILPATVDSIVYRVRAFDSAGCWDDDDIKVRVFKTGPDIFVPTAFTPNGDGRNEIAMPVLIGMKQLNYYRVFNRWGEMVYSTSEIGKGWNGVYAGKPQPSGTFVFVAEAVDYTGKTVLKKGTLVLIR